mgnify:CR=1 FL=1
MMLRRGVMVEGSGVVPLARNETMNPGAPGPCRARKYIPDPAISVPLSLAAAPAPAEGTSGNATGKSGGSCAWSEAKVVRKSHDEYVSSGRATKPGTDRSETQSVERPARHQGDVRLPRCRRHICGAGERGLIEASGQGPAELIHEIADEQPARADLRQRAVVLRNQQGLVPVAPRYWYASYMSSMTPLLKESESPGR